MDDFLKSIEKKIVKLSFKQQVLFAVLTCEKLLPNYRQFSDTEKWGNIEVLEDAIVMIYQYLQDIEVNDEELDAAYEKISEITPDVERFKGDLASYALDTCSAVSDAVEFLLSEDQSYLINIVSIAQETIDMFVQESEELDPIDEYLDKKIAQNQYMKREYKRQHEILRKLLGAEIDLPFISSMRDFNNSTGAIIELSLVN
ncbi:YjaG family protein [Emticicia fontis]